jgi:23S rRNA pseudouridine1911/1915/1917 synthase
VTRHDPRTLPPQILYLDQDVLAIDKRPGMLSVPGRGAAPCALDLLPPPPADEDTPPAMSSPGPRRSPWRVVHRLDRDASGVQLYAATLAAQRHLAAQFLDHRVEKIYYALVCGYVASADGQIDLPLQFDRHAQRAVVSPRRGKPALTYFRVVERVAGHTLLECRPVTGRRHQIRAHLAAIGHPLSVDPLYGGGHEILLSQYKPDYKPNRSGEERPLISRLTLHAARITFEHPRSGQQITIEAPMPRDLRATVRQLARFA